MSLQYDPAWAVATLLLWVRLGALWVASPLVNATQVPATVVVILTLVWSGTLAAVLPQLPPPPPTVWHLLLPLLGEAVLGALLGFALRCAFAAYNLGGRLLDVQMGFGMAGVYDPVNQGHTPVLGSALALLGVAVFFGSDGHLAMMRGLQHAAEVVPPGRFIEVPQPSTVLLPFAAMFTTGLLVVAPVVFVLLLADVALAIMSRVLPQMNVFFVGIPVKVLTGLAVLAITAPAVGTAMARSQAAVFRFWDGVLR